MNALFASVEYILSVFSESVQSADARFFAKLHSAPATEQGVTFTSTKVRKLMAALQPETIGAVHRAAVPISVEIDAMLVSVPADTDLSQIADELVAELEAICLRRDFIDVFAKGLMARRILVNLGIGV